MNLFLNLNLSTANPCGPLKPLMNMFLIKENSFLVYFMYTLSPGTPFGPRIPAQPFVENGKLRLKLFIDYFFVIVIVITVLP